METPVYRKFLLMVTELHVRGYQRLRIAPGMSPSGLSWRCSIAPADNFSKYNGALIEKHNDLVASYSFGKDSRYIDDVDAERLTPSAMARKFIEKYPKIVQAGKGSDWLYAGWHLEMLHLTYPDGLPIAYADYSVPAYYLTVINSNQDIRIPLPPPGLL